MIITAIIDCMTEPNFLSISWLFFKLWFLKILKNWTRLAELLPLKFSSPTYRLFMGGIFYSNSAAHFPDWKISFFSFLYQTPELLCRWIISHVWIVWCVLHQKVSSQLLMAATIWSEHAKMRLSPTLKGSINKCVIALCAAACVFGRLHKRRGSRFNLLLAARSPSHIPSLCTMHL